MKALFSFFMVFITNIFGIEPAINQDVTPTEPPYVEVGSNPPVTALPAKIIVSPSPNARTSNKPAATSFNQKCGQMDSGTYACRVVNGNNRCYYCNNGNYIYSDNSKCAGGCPSSNQNCADFNHDTYGCRLVDGNNRCYYCNNGSYIYSDSSKCHGGCPQIMRNCEGFNHGSYACKVVDGNNRCYYCNNGDLIYSNNSMCAGSCR